MKPYPTLAGLQADLARRATTCAALVDGYLQAINSRKSLNVFVEVYAGEARALAKAVDDKLANGTAGKLAGLVFAIKDNISHKGHATTAGSNILKGYTSIYTATALQRLLNEDAIVLGRLNCDEFAMGSSNENSAYGPARHPLDESRVPGGSSGGSAAAVAAGLVHATLGSDTGGSVRQPAAYCGVVGLKPTYGRISRYGLIAYGSSFDQIGPLTRSVEDTARLLQVMGGNDPLDNTSATTAVDDYPALLKDDGKKYKIALLGGTLDVGGLMPDVKKRTDEIIALLRADGHTVETVDFPYLEYLVPTYYILATAEASSNLSRYDGIRYGHRAQNATSLADLYRKSRTEGFGAEVKRRIMLGTFVLSSGYYDAYYTKAQKVRRLIQESTRSILKSHDFIFTPTTPDTAFKIGEKMEDPISMYLTDIFTVYANLCGCPAISIPGGQDRNGLPMGFQFMSDYFTEGKLLCFAHHLQGKIN